MTDAKQALSDLVRAVRQYQEQCAPFPPLHAEQIEARATLEATVRAAERVLDE